MLLEPSGKVRDDIWNEGTKHGHAKYYYQSGDERKLNRFTYTLTLVT